MAEGKKQRKFGRNGRNGRSNSSKLQVARTAANKARNARRAAMLAKAVRSVGVPRGAARALRRAVKFCGEPHALIVAWTPMRYVVSIIGEHPAEQLLSLRF